MTPSRLQIRTLRMRIPWALVCGERLYCRSYLHKRLRLCNTHIIILLCWYKVAITPLYSQFWMYWLTISNRHQKYERSGVIEIHQCKKSNKVTAPLPLVYACYAVLNVCMYIVIFEPLMHTFEFFSCFSVLVSSLYAKMSSRNPHLIERSKIPEDEDLCCDIHMFFPSFQIHTHIHARHVRVCSRLKEREGSKMNHTFIIQKKCIYKYIQKVNESA